MCKVMVGHCLQTSGSPDHNCSLFNVSEQDFHRTIRQVRAVSCVTGEPYCCQARLDGLQSQVLTLKNTNHDTYSYVLMSIRLVKCIHTFRLQSPARISEPCAQTLYCVLNGFEVISK
jgi:hypothetical protein